MAVNLATSDIVAQAVLELEAAPISSFAEDHEFPRNLAKHYPRALDTCLTASNWSFARVLAALPQATAPSGAAEDPDLPYLFKVPSDCVKLRDVDGDTIAWRRDEGFIRASAPASLNIRYTRRITDETKLPATFREWVALELAIRLAPKHLQTRTKRADLKTMALDARRIALEEDRNMASGVRWDGDDDAASDWVELATR